jgi:hypothetical protein
MVITLDICKTIRLKSRGDFRREHCSMPPFWLNVRKSDVINIHLPIGNAAEVTHLQAKERSAACSFTVTHGFSLPFPLARVYIYWELYIPKPTKPQIRWTKNRLFLA